MVIKKLYFIGALIIVFASSCTEEKNHKVNSEDQFPASEFFNKTAKPSQLFTISIERDTLIEGEEGTIIFFPKNCFISEDGSEVSGDVIIELKEFYKVSDMLLNNLTTTSNGQTLETGGMVFISVKNKNILIKDSLMLKMPNKLKIQNPSIFYGENENNTINWHKDTINTVVQIKITGISALGSDTIYEYSDKTISKNKQLLNYYVMGASKLGWINCDRFLGSKNTVQITVKSNIDEKHYIVLENYNSIIPGFSNKNKEVVFKTIPANQNINLLSIKIINDKLYYNLQKINTSEEVQVEAVSYNATTIQNLKNVLNKFN